MDINIERKDGFQFERWSKFRSAVSELSSRKLSAATGLALSQAGLIELVHSSGSEFYPNSSFHKYRLSTKGELVLLDLQAEDFEGTESSHKPEIVPVEIMRLAIRHKFPPDQGWVIFEELSNGMDGRRIDLFAVNVWRSKKLRRVAFEIKRYRSDYLKEIRNPEKRQKFETFANAFYFVTPNKMIDTEELPEGTGLIEISQAGEATYRRRAPDLESPPPDWRFLANILRKYGERRLKPDIPFPE